MAEPTSLESIQALHADLLALSESRLLHIERLGNQLEAHIKDFRDLLDKKPRKDQSRQKLATGAYCRRPQVVQSTFAANQSEQVSLISMNTTLSTRNSSKRPCR